VYWQQILNIFTIARYENSIDDGLCTDVPDHPFVRSSYDSNAVPANVDDFYEDGSYSADHQDDSAAVEIWVDMQ